MTAIYAHRGASGDAPENTLAAFAEGWRQGADGMECDIHLSADGELIVSHDAHTGRVAKKKQVIAQTAWADLREVDVGSWKAAPYAGERIPRLKEVLDALPDGKRIWIEVKCGVSAIAPLARLLNTYTDLKERCAVMCFDAAVVERAAQVLPDVMPVLLIDFKAQDGRWVPSGVESVERAANCRARALGWRCCEAIDPAAVAVARTQKMHLLSWTVNQPADARRLHALGLDGLITDWPGRIRTALQ